MKITNKARLKKLKTDLHYAQLGTRLAIMSLRGSIEQCKRISIEMRQVQAEMGRGKR